VEKIKGRAKHFDLNVTPQEARAVLENAGNLGTEVSVVVTAGGEIQNPVVTVEVRSTGGKKRFNALADGINEGVIKPRALPSLPTRTSHAHQ